MMNAAMQEMICFICKQDLDTRDRFPRLLPNTGDTICQVCVQGIINNKIELAELEDEINILKQQKPNLSLDDFPLNQALIRILSVGMSRTYKETSNLNSTDSKVVDQPMHKMLSDQDFDGPEALTTSFDDQPNRSVQSQNYLDEISSSNKKRKSKSSLRIPKRGGFATQVKNLKSEFDESLNQQTDIKLCTIHKRNLEVVCLDCKQNICTNCALFGQHKGHTIHSLDDILMILTDRAQDIFDKVESLQKQLVQVRRESFDHRFKECLKELIKQQQSKIKYEFDNIRMLIDDQEQKSLNMIQEQVYQKSSCWDQWWIDHAQQVDNTNYCQEWCLQAKYMIESLADVKLCKQPYWDLLVLSENTKMKGVTFQRELQQFITEVDHQLTEVCKSQYQLQFNTLPISMSLEDFCKVVKQPQQKFMTQSFATTQRVQSPKHQTLRRMINKEILNPYMQQQHNDSDLLSNDPNLTEFGRSSIESDFRVSQHQTNDFNQFAFTLEVQPLQQSNNLFYSLNQIALQKQKSSLLVNQSQRFHRNVTPSQQQEGENTSLSPLTHTKETQSNQLQQTLKLGQKKKPVSIGSSFPTKYQQLFEQLKNGVCPDQIIEIQGIDFTSQMIQFLGLEVKNWKIKTLKLMKCKITDDNIQSFFQCNQNKISQKALGQSNDNLQSLNLAQNLLTDRAIDMIKELITQGLINKNLKNIILSSNKINARKCQSKILELKRNGLTLTL